MSNYSRNLNHDDLSKFSNRLWALMKDKRIDTPKGLATALYDKGLVSKYDIYYYDSDDKETRKRAIESVEKRIRKHIKDKEDPNDFDMEGVQGEFISAYCEFFNCSADYLFGLTELKTNDTDIRMISNYIGLSEESIKNLRWITSDNKKVYYAGYSTKQLTIALNTLLESVSLYHYIRKLIDAAEALHEYKELSVFEDVCNSIPEKYREYALKIFSDGIDALASGIRPSKTLCKYADMLEAASADDYSRNSEIEEARRDYKICMYELDEKHKKMVEDMVNKLYKEASLFD